MAIDPYSPCPGGLGKKIKFCCSDLITDLEKIERLREADQRAACLEYIEKLEAKHPGRACLITTKADLLRDLGRTQEADAALKDLLDQNADNPVALAEAALLACEEGDPLRALSLVQKALSAGDSIPGKVVEATRETAITLLEHRHIVPGRQLLTLYVASMTDGQDREAMEMLSRVVRSPRTPLLLKQQWSLQAPNEADWKDEYQGALKSRSWTQFQERLEGLIQRHGDQAPLWRSLAIIRSWLADYRGAAQAWRKYASFDIPLDDAVEAEATAQLLDPDVTDMVDLVVVEYQIHDWERLLEVLNAQDRLAQMSTEALPRVEGRPGPQALYMVLDRPKQAEGELDPETTPRVIGQLYVFGRETDREPRLQVVAYRGPRLDNCQELIAEVTFGMLGPAREVEVVQQETPAAVELESTWFIDKRPDPARIDEIAASHREAYLLQRWPKTPLKALGGKTPEQAAKDEKLRIPLLAALLLLQTELEQDQVEFDFNRLRQQLNLPPETLLELDGQALETISPARLARLNFERLGPEDLGTALARAAMIGVIRAQRQAALECLRRSAEDRPVPAGACYEILAHTTQSGQQQLEYLQQASKAYVEAGESCAGPDVQQLEAYIQRQDKDAALQMIVHLIDNHLNDQQYGGLVLNVLANLGFVRPDGKVLRPKLDAQSIITPGGEESGKIWTPDTERGGQKPALWVPGS